MKAIFLAASAPTLLLCGALTQIFVSENLGGQYDSYGMGETDYSAGFFLVFIPSSVIVYPVCLLITLAVWLLYFSIFIDSPWRERPPPPSPSADPPDSVAHGSVAAKSR